MTPSRTTGAFILEMGQGFFFSSRAVFSAFISLGYGTLKVFAYCVIRTMLICELLVEEAPECMTDFSIEIAVSIASAWGKRALSWK